MSHDWKVEPTKIMTRDEVRRCLEYVDALPGNTGWTTEIIFRLAVCCGLRVSEIASLNIANIVGGDRAYVHVKKGKGNKARRVPLSWDRQTKNSLLDWRARRTGEDMAKLGDALLINKFRGRFTRWGIAGQFEKVTLAVLGRKVNAHCGRHTWVSHALEVKSPAAVRDAAGHSNLSVTDTYAHVLEEVYAEESDLYQGVA